MSRWTTTSSRTSSQCRDHRSARDCGSVRGPRRHYRIGVKPGACRRPNHRDVQSAEIVPLHKPALTSSVLPLLNREAIAPDGEARSEPSACATIRRQQTAAGAGYRSRRKASVSALKPSGRVPFPKTRSADESCGHSWKPEAMRECRRLDQAGVCKSVEPPSASAATSRSPSATREASGASADTSRRPRHRRESVKRHAPGQAGSVALREQRVTPARSAVRLCALASRPRALGSRAA